VVVPVPDSGIVAALGYSEESGIPFAMGLMRNHYVGRTFIEPEQSIRHFGVKLKLNAVRGVLKGKRVVVGGRLDRPGDESQKIAQMVREAGARRGPHADLVAPDLLPVFLRDRHPDAATSS